PGLLGASRQLGNRDVTGDPVGRARTRPRRLGLLTYAADLLRAAGVEPASRRWVLRARHAPFESDRPSPRRRIAPRDRGEQRARGWMPRPAEHLVHGAGLHE